jgi:hypothetical protein
MSLWLGSPAKDETRVTFGIISQEFPPCRAEHSVPVEILLI